MIESKLQDHVPAPGVPDQDGPFELELIHEGKQVATIRREIEFAIGAIATTMSALIYCDNSVVLSQTWGNKVPDPVGGGESMQEHDWRATTTPFAVCQAESIRQDDRRVDWGR